MEAILSQGVDAQSPRCVQDGQLPLGSGQQWSVGHCRAFAAGNEVIGSWRELLAIVKVRNPARVLLLMSVCRRGGDLPCTNRGCTRVACVCAATGGGLAGEHQRSKGAA